mmetsp:Transcript_133039/g.370882  ORF Transcript_133039/g.370882 Transcript_133039/m.370882 type:complete len:294 (+) Transcript_133039:755-1636(+)
MGCCSPACTKLPAAPPAARADSSTKRSARFRGRLLGPSAAPLRPRAPVRASCRPCSSLPARSEPSICSRPAGGRGRRLALPASSSSYFSATSWSRTRRPTVTGVLDCSRLAPPLCFASTAMALRRLFTACTMSFSSLLNSLASFSRMAVACSKASVSAAICFFNAAIVTTCLPASALRVSVSELSSRSLASASAIAWVFSFSFVSHQQVILSYMPDSLSASAISSAFILPSRRTTRFTGLFSPSSASAAASRSAEDARPRRARALGRRPRTTSTKHKARAIAEEARARGRELR